MDKANILVVEDKLVTAQAIKSALEELGYTVAAVVRVGEEAVQKTIELQPDLVLMDIALPGAIDGIEAAQQIYNNCNIPVIFLTAYSDSKTLQRAKINPPFGYLQKPFEARVLHTTIQMALSRHKASTEVLYRLAAIVESSEDAIISKTLDGTIVSWNAGAEKIFGYRPEEAIGRSISLLVPSDYVDEIPQILAKIRRGEKVEHYETVRRRKDGQLIDISLTISPIKDAMGKVIGASKVARDITQRKQTEQALRDSEERFRNAFDYAAIGMGLVALDGRFLKVNRSYCEITGYSEAELLATSIQKITHPDDLDAYLSYAHQLLTGEIRCYQMEKRYIHKQGHIVWVLLSGSLVRDDRGQPLYFIAQVQDITARKHAEAALQASEEQLQLALEGSGDGWWDWNIVTGEVKYSSRWLEMLNYEVGELPGNFSTWKRMIHPDDKPWVMARLDAHFEDSSVPYEFDYRLLTKAGEWKWIANYGKVVMRDEHGNPLRISGTHRDISNRKQAEAEREQLLQQIEYERSRLEAVLRQMPAAIWILEAPSGKLVLYNDKVEAVLGHPSPLGERLEDLSEFFAIHPDGTPYAPEEYPIARSLLTGEVVINEEMHYRKGDGSHAILAIYSSPIRDAQGQIIAAIGAAFDITQSKQTELEIKRSKDLKEAIFNQSTDAIFLVDPQTLLVLDCNDRAVELFEAHSKDELIGIVGHTLQRQPFTPEELVAIRQEIDTTGIWSRELEYITKQSNRFWGNLATQQINVAGRAINLVRVSDITKRKDAEKELEFQAVITKNMAEGICLIKATDWTIVYANSKFETMFGYDIGELSGKPVSILNYQNEGTSTEETVRRIVDGIERYGAATYKIPNVKKDGTPFWCQATISTFEHPDYGTVYVAVQHDITEQKQAQEQINASLKEKEVLLKEIHHRVKNNLQIVKSLLQMQSRRTKDKEAILVLNDSQNRISSIALVHEKLYRSEHLATIDFAQYIPDLISHLFDTYNISSSTVTLELDIDHIILEIDAAIPCGLIINELVSNALKYAFSDHRQGKIQVKFHAESNETISLIVQDNGIGIPDEFDIETTQSLGLTLVQGLVEQLEGSIELDRSGGTSFKITLPRN